MLGLTERQFLLLKYWLPALASGIVAWSLFLSVDTPLVRASGLALVIVGIGLALRRMGSILAFMGSLTLALCPAFWSQTGGGQGDPATIVLAIAAAIFAVLIGVVVSKRPTLSLGLGVIIFALFFWSQIGTPRSIRLTSFVVAWLLYLVIDLLLLTNRRQDDESPPPPLLQIKFMPSELNGIQFYHTWGILLLFGIGVLNDSLLTLLAPAILLSFFLSNVRLSTLYWVLISLVIGIGIRGLYADYIQAQSHLLNLVAWRNAREWISLVRFIINQFTVVGGVFGILGLARLARWYPPLGIVTMVAYGAYGLFGLVYNGGNRAVLLLPMLVIHVLWMTYAVFTLSEWVKKTFPKQGVWLQRVLQASYVLLPFLLWTSQA